MILKPKHEIAIMKTAFVFAECSVSTRLKVGAVIEKEGRIVSCGYNALPVFLDGCLEGEDGLTLPQVRHAEKSALMGMLRAGISPIGSTLYCTHSCCEFCAIDIIDAGIKRVVYSLQYRSEEGLDLLRSSGIIVDRLEL